MNTDQLLASTYAPLRLSVGTRLRAGTVVSCVGGGPTGFVYRVLDERGNQLAVREYFPPMLATRLHDEVCPQPHCEAAFESGLKVFDEDGWQMAAHEHPGLLKVQHSWTERGTSYQAMPWCEGQTLDLIVRASPVSPSEAELGNWLRAMADALGPIHRRHGVHGHLSPAQVMRLASGRVLLMEVSRSRRLVVRDPRDVERNPYAALECGGDNRYGPMGPWTDIYALAAIVAFALRGRAPQTPARRLPDDTQEPLARSVVGHYSADFLQGIDAGLALRPRARPRDLGSFLARLGLPERRSRPRTAGESLLVNLHLSETATPEPAADEATEAMPSVAAAESAAASVIEAASMRRPMPQADADGVIDLDVAPTAGVADDDTRDEPPVQIDLAAIAPAAPRKPARATAALAAAWLIGLGAVAAVMAVGVASFDRPAETAASAGAVAPLAASAPVPVPESVAPPAIVAEAARAPDAVASSPIPEPLEPTAAGVAVARPAEAQAAGVAEPPAAPTEALATAPPVIEEPASPAPIAARSATPVATKAKLTRAPAVSPPAGAAAPIEAAAPASPCPDLLARQYIGRRLDDAERAQMNAQCR